MLVGFKELATLDSFTLPAMAAAGWKGMSKDICGTCFDMRRCLTLTHFNVQRKHPAASVCHQAPLSGHKSWIQRGSQVLTTTSVAVSGAVRQVHISRKQQYARRQAVHRDTAHKGSMITPAQPVRQIQTCPTSGKRCRSSRLRPARSAYR